MINIYKKILIVLISILLIFTTVSITYHKTEAFAQKIITETMEKGAKKAIFFYVHNRAKKLAVEVAKKEVAEEVAQQYTKKAGYKIVERKAIKAPNIPGGSRRYRVLDNATYLKERNAEMMAQMNKKLEKAIMDNIDKMIFGRTLKTWEKVLDFFLDVRLWAGTATFVGLTLTGSLKEEMEELVFQSLIDAGWIIPLNERITAINYKELPINRHTQETIDLNNKDVVANRNTDRINRKQTVNRSSYTDIDVNLNPTVPAKGQLYIIDSSSPLFRGTNDYQYMEFSHGNLSEYGHLRIMINALRPQLLLTDFNNLGDMSAYLNGMEIQQSDPYDPDPEGFINATGFLFFDYQNQITNLLSNIKQIRFNIAKNGIDYHMRIISFNDDILDLYFSGIFTRSNGVEVEDMRFSIFRYRTYDRNYMNNIQVREINSSNIYSSTHAVENKADFSGYFAEEETKTVYDSKNEKGEDVIYFPTPEQAIIKDPETDKDLEIQIDPESEEAIIVDKETGQPIPEDAQVPEVEFPTEPADPETGEPEPADPPSEDSPVLPPSDDPPFSGEEGDMCDANLNIETLDGIEEFTHKFPFSLPWDVFRALEAWFGEMGSEEPRFEVELAGEEFTIEIPDAMLAWTPLFRSIIVIGFDVSLIYALRKWFGGAE